MVFELTFRRKLYVFIPSAELSWGLTVSEQIKNKCKKKYEFICRISGMKILYKVRKKAINICSRVKMSNYSKL